MTILVRGLLAIAAVSLLPASAAFATSADKQASFVIDGNTGAVLHDQQADEPRYPASLTKMMTLYMAFNELKAGRMSDDTMLTVSVACASMAPSKIGLEVGERISLGNAIKAVVTKSANDMACAIAESISGSESQFAQRMTQQARQIGMSSTTFRNASGLPDPRQVTTARDMVTLGLRLRDDHPEYYSVFQLRSFSYGGKTYRSHNTLMNGFAGMDGIKTGYTRASGFNLVSSVQRDGKYVVGAVFGGVSASVRNAHMRMILFHSLTRASTTKTRKSAPVLIARGKPAPAPKPVTLANADVAEKKAAPEAKPRKKDVATPAPAPVAAKTVQAQAADDPAIKIAKVKPVLVATKTAPDTATPAKPRPQFVTASATPRLDLGAPKPRTQEPAPTAAETAARSQAADTGAQQARDILSSGAATPAAAPPAPAKVAATSTSGGYQIQVGAFASAEEAQKHLETVRGRAVSLLKDRRSSAEQATVGSKQIYRARFAEFDNAGASAACSTLRQQKVDCMVLKSQ